VSLMINIEGLRKEKYITQLQWEASVWFAELTPKSMPWHAVRHACNDVSELNRAHNVDPWMILNRCCVSRVTIEKRDLVIGVLREALNAVHRVMKRQGKEAA
jgi:hypothetical protein